MTERQRSRVAALERRRDHLSERLDRWDTRRDPSRTRAELAAVKWALTVLSAADRHGVLNDLEVAA